MRHWKRTLRRGAAGLTLGAAALAGTVGPLTAQAAPAASPPTVTLDDAVKAALEHHPQVVRAEGSVRTAAAAEKSALGAYLPTLSLSTNGSLSSSTQFGTQTGELGTTSTSSLTGGVRDSYSAGLSASWDVYTGGRRGAEKDQAAAQSAAAEASLSEEEFAVTLSTKQAYYDVLRAQELEGVAAASVKSAQEGIDAAQQRMNVGSATRSDVLRAQLELNTAKQSLLEAQNQERTATYALGRLMGEDGPVSAAPDASLDVKPVGIDGEALVEELVAKSPSVVAAQASVTSADAGTKVAKSQYLPTVRLSSGYSLSTTDALLAAGQGGWSLGIGVSVPIFDGFQRSQSTEQAQVQKSVATAELDDARRGVRADAQKALGTLDLAASKMELADEAVTAATEDLRVQKERYTMGASTILQQSLVQAQTDRVTARFDYQVALAQLEALAGREL
jgi:outer membrane protein TolC